jgi:hypothetical protein
LFGLFGWRPFVAVVELLANSALRRFQLKR